MSDEDYVTKVNYNFLGEYSETLWLAGYTVTCFLVSFLLSHPQLLVGTVVNALLVLAALEFNGKGAGVKLMAPVLAPSLGAVSKGALVGALSMFLVYMVPFIWVANAILVFGMRFTKVNVYLRLVGSVLLKAGFLFGSAFVMVQLGIIPKPMLVAMGPMQLYTGFAGGFAAIAIWKLKQKFLN